MTQKTDNKTYLPRIADKLLEERLEMELLFMGMPENYEYKGSELERAVLSHIQRSCQH